MSDEASVQRYVALATDEAKRIDIFFNNAGIEGPVHPIADYPLADFRRVVDVNLIGVFLGLKHVIPAMAATGGGSIINSSSVAGLTGTPGICAYNATKHGVIGLTRSAAAEWAGRGVRVNWINPGPIASRMMASLEERHGARQGARDAGAIQCDDSRRTLWDTGRSGGGGRISGFRRRALFAWRDLHD